MAELKKSQNIMYILDTVYHLKTTKINLIWTLKLAWYTTPNLGKISKIILDNYIPIKKKIKSHFISGLILMKLYNG